MRRLSLALLMALIGCAGPSDGGEARSGTASALDLDTQPPPSEMPEPPADGLSPEPGPPSPVPLGPDPETAIAPEAPAVDVMALDGSHSMSLGGPSNGTLTGGVALPESGPGLRSNPRRPNVEGYFGTVEMVQGLARAAEMVERELPGGELTVNDIGFEHGGSIPHHGSHQSGRDVDTLFYLLDRQGNPIRSKGIPIDPDGRGWDFGDLADPTDDVRVRIDVPRTWRFVQALLEDEQAHVQRIFVVEHVRQMLLDQAIRVRAPRMTRLRFEQATCQPNSPHDDHLHFRLFCTAEDIRAGCEDTYPMYGWRRRELRAEDVEPVIARHPRRRRPSRAQAASPAGARARAGRMHRRVRAFLDRREEWIVKPHPGRPWCR